jgi:hypothetical protein
LRWYKYGDYELRIPGPHSGPLTHNRLKKLIAYDKKTGEFIRLVSSGGEPAGPIKNLPSTSDGYIHIAVDGVTYAAHRLAFFYVEGRWPPHHLDHKNLIRTDNRWNNLRPATWSQNNHHMILTNKTGFRGVTFMPTTKKFRSKIRVDGVHFYLGVFDSPEEAHAAYCSAALRYFGEFATTQTKGGHHS